LLKKVVAECDAAIVGLGNWGGCTSWSIHDTVQLIRGRRPTIEVITEQFDALARSIVRANKLPESTLVMIPGNPEFVSSERLAILADLALAEIVGKLTAVIVK
jgi:hypothetical protein